MTDIPGFETEYRCPDCRRAFLVRRLDDEYLCPGCGYTEEALNSEAPKPVTVYDKDGNKINGFEN